MGSVAQVAANRPIVLEPVTGNIGARVSCFDISAEHPAEVIHQLNEALHAYGVLFFPATKPISDTDHYRLARLFGEIDPHNAQADFFTIDSELTPLGTYPTDHWHTDGTHRPVPAQTSILRCVTAPSAGGDTMWASMYAAFEALSSNVQRFLIGLEAVHSTAAVAKRDLTRKIPIVEATHPVVLRDPFTKREMLYVNSLYTDRIVGLSEHESAHILAMLFEHINTPDFHVRLRWESHAIAVWDNRVTQHRVINDHREHRTMKRLMARGEAPTPA
jgi:taurine dioxygenase